MAASAASSGQDPTPGGNVMLGGTVFQMVSITAYVMCAGEFFYRWFSDRLFHKEAPASKADVMRRDMDQYMKTMIVALIFNTTCLFIRSVYRTLELANGWTGTIITTQWYFNVFDGGMITLAIYTLNFAHPGFLLSSATIVRPKEIQLDRISVHDLGDEPNT